jgi:arginine/lysine/ornithine decarboxylase
VLVDRNCHKSVLHGLQLAKARPVFLFPEIDGELGLAGGFKETEIEQAFHAYPDIKACILTYPTYYGMVYDLQPIIEMAHRHHCLVVIDEAHGPHFHIGAPFPASAMDLGADAVVHSAHKMLPALTMGSFLHIKNAQFPIDRLEYYLSVLQTSSPSYLIMMSLDYARWYAANFNAEDIRYTMSQRKFLISRLKEIKGLEVLERGDQDPLKLLVSCPGVSGFDLQSAFEHAGVYPEMADLNFAVLVLPLLKEGMAFPYSEASDRINRALKQDFPKRKVRKAPVYFSGGVAGLSLSYEEMEERPVEWVSFGAAADRIAAKTVTPYPPGVPLLMPGERITASHIERIKSLRAYGAKFQADAHFKHEQLAVYL